MNITILMGLFPSQDQAAEARSSSTVVTIQVQDADDQNPAFARDHYMAVIPDNPVKVSLSQSSYLTLNYSRKHVEYPVSVD